MGRTLAGFVAGLIFGTGLIIAGMTNPAKILNFLDVAGTWDPSLAFVMGGAVVVTFVGYRLALPAGRPMFDSRFFMPTAREIDIRLVGGSAVFGIGWGLIGLCPGPALTIAGIAGPGIAIFLVAMTLGMIAVRVAGWTTARHELAVQERRSV